MKWPGQSKQGKLPDQSLGPAANAKSRESSAGLNRLRDGTPYVTQSLHDRLDVDPIDDPVLNAGCVANDEVHIDVGLSGQSTCDCPGSGFDSADRCTRCRVHGRVRIQRDDADAKAHDEGLPLIPAKFRNRYSKLWQVL